MKAQAAIETYLRTHGMAHSYELVKFTHDFRKAICRLQKKGLPIHNVRPLGEPAVYVLQKSNKDLPLFRKREE